MLIVRILPRSASKSETHRVSCCSHSQARCHHRVPNITYDESRGLRKHTSPVVNGVWGRENRDTNDALKFCEWSPDVVGRFEVSTTGASAGRCSVFRSPVRDCCAASWFHGTLFAAVRATAHQVKTKLKFSPMAMSIWGANASAQ